LCILGRVFQSGTARKRLVENGSVLADARNVELFTMLAVDY
jgi:hypothetical protein